MGTIPEPLPETLQWTLPGSDGSFLGLRTEENMGTSLDALSFDEGVVVIHVVQNSPAARAGLQPGDVVLALDEQPVSDPAGLDALVARCEPGARVTLAVRRGDTLFDVPVGLVAASGPPLEEAYPRWRMDPARSRACWATTPEGVLLASAPEESPFPRAGLAVGSRVLAVDGRPVTSARELIRALTAHPPGATVPVEAVDAEGRERTARIQLHDVPRRLTGFRLPLLIDYTATPDGRKTTFSLIDLWFFELYRYERDGHEQRWSLLEIFGWEPLRFSTGIGELSG